PILIQKPLASSLHEARALVAIAREAGVPMMVNQNSLFVPACTALEPYLRDPKYLGTPYYCEINNRHWAPPRPDHWYETTERWVTAGMAIHHFALVRHWFGDAETVYCLQARDASQHAAGDTLSAVSIRFKSGTQALIVNNWSHRGSRVGDRARPHPHEEIIIQGDLGSISGDTAQFCVVSDALGEAKLYPKITGAWFPDAFGHSMRHFIEALDAGRPFLCEATDNLKTLAIMEAAYRSAKTGNAVRVDDLLAEETCGA
ncbi:MAG: Gfo/Idh/MocA family oxidoreductase, partial [Chloroflexota bacterium]|nr:Gfo/Idh/MocA family oxidoreductase [Chloroflexota bacterium]